MVYSEQDFGYSQDFFCSWFMSIKGIIVMDMHNIRNQVTEASWMQWVYIPTFFFCLLKVKLALSVHYNCKSDFNAIVSFQMPCNLLIAVELFMMQLSQSTVNLILYLWGFSCLGWVPVVFFCVGMLTLWIILVPSCRISIVAFVFWHGLTRSVWLRWVKFKTRYILLINESSEYHAMQG